MDMVSGMKPVTFLGDSLKALRGFPDAARQDAGFQIDRLQQGLQPDDFKPMPGVGAVVEALRVWCQHGTFRVLYFVRLVDAVLVLYASQKKTQATPKADVDLAARRLRDWTRTHP